jgi:hypothetical protein
MSSSLVLTLASSSESHCEKFSATHFARANSKGSFCDFFLFPPPCLLSLNSAADISTVILCDVQQGAMWKTTEKNERGKEAGRCIFFSLSFPTLSPSRPLRKPNGYTVFVPVSDSGRTEKIISRICVVDLCFTLVSHFFSPPLQISKEAMAAPHKHERIGPVLFPFKPYASQVQVITGVLRALKQVRPLSSGIDRIFASQGRFLSTAAAADKYATCPRFTPGGQCAH